MSVKNETALLAWCMRRKGWDEETGELNNCVVADEWDVADYIRRVESMLKKLFSTKAKLFSVVHVGQFKRSVIRATALGQELIDLLQGDLGLIFDNYAYYEFNPYISLYVDVVYRLDLDRLAVSLSDEQVDNLFVALASLQLGVEEFRRMGQGCEFKNKLRNFRRSADKNLFGVKQYIDEMFRIYSRLMVVRLDVGYRKALNDAESGQRIEYERVFKDRVELFKRIRKKSGKKLVGFVWKLEYGLEKTYHYHLLLFFDGAQVQEDISWGKMIGEIWVGEVTGGEGVYFNCNKNKSDYKLCGIGTVEYHDKEKRDNLLLAASYLTKPDYYLRMVLPGGGRSLGKGVIPQGASRKNGRPRMRMHI